MAPTLKIRYKRAVKYARDFHASSKTNLKNGDCSLALRHFGASSEALGEAAALYEELHGVTDEGNPVQESLWPGQNALEEQIRSRCFCASSLSGAGRKRRHARRRK